MSGKIHMAVFAVLVLAQWAVPLSMIRQHEAALDKGELWQFRCEMVDPYDPFRGRYVRITVNAGDATTDAEDFTSRQGGYVTLKQDEDGYAQFDRFTLSPPETGAYLQVEYAWRMNEQGEVQVTFPLDRYYMNEHAAPEAERVYRDAMRSEGREARLDVRVLDGLAVIEGLYIDGTPVEAYVRGERQPTTAVTPG